MMKQQAENKCRSTYAATRRSIVAAMGGASRGVPMVVVLNDASSVKELYR